MLRRKAHRGEVGDGGGSSNLSSSRVPSYLKDKPLAHASRVGASASNSATGRTQISSFLRNGLLAMMSVFVFISFVVSPNITDKSNNKNSAGSAVGMNAMEERLRGSITSGKGKSYPQNEPLRPKHPRADEHDHDQFDSYPQPQRLPPVPDSKQESLVDFDTDIEKGKSEPKNKGRPLSNAASEAMKRQPSFWVDSERKLKAELLELSERQRQGLDKGAKVLSRYLGEDVKAWATKEEEEEWLQMVKKKKEEMRKVEMEERMKRKEVGVGPNADAASEKADFADAKQVLGKGFDPIVHEALAAVAEGKDSRIDDGESDEQSLMGKDEKEQYFNKKNGYDGIKKVESEGINSDRRNFPSPMDAAKAEEDDSKEVVVLLEPVIGQHRPSKDAVFAFAEGYDLNIYLCFVESLRSTGFDGDIVLSVSALKNLKKGVEDYLRSVENMVVYTVEWTCIDGEGNLTHETKEGIRHCQMNGFYGLHDINEPDETPHAVPDPREARPVATARYELYWLWATKYDSHSWIVLIDSRDAYFQLDPFQNVDREDSKENTDGALHFFAENAEVANLGDSSYNRGWLTKAYGQEAVSQFFDGAVVCSGSTMGEQVAIESYLRAMVAEFDQTKCKAKGCDQGFHNYLYYSHKLVGATGIGSIKVHSQGDGIINNLGVMRTKPLSEWGVLDVDTKIVLNWDKSPSPVVHQFDRDEELNKIIKARKKDYMAKWKEGQSKVGGVG